MQITSCLYSARKSMNVNNKNNNRKSINVNNKTSNKEPTRSELMFKQDILDAKEEKVELVFD